MTTSKIMGLSFLTFLLHWISPAYAELKITTSCIWVTEHDGFQYATWSDFKNLTDPEDCVNALGITLLITEPLRGKQTYDGDFLLNDSEGNMMSMCESKTVQPMQSEEQKNLLNWLLEHRPGMTDPQYLELLRTESWQRVIRSHFSYSCQSVAT